MNIGKCISLPYLKKYSLLILMLFLNSACAEDNSDDSTLINTKHLDFLYEKINVEGNQMGIIHIYSNYPDYKWVGDDDEGIACVDDAARAALFYMKYYNVRMDAASYNKLKNLVKFLLYMQAENGFYYNFIWHDHSINRTFKTSVAEPNWWTWRAILTLSKAYFFFEQKDPDLCETIKTSLIHAVDSTTKWMNKNTAKSYVDYGGLKFPVWLPYETAADQSAILLEGLVGYYQIEKDPEILKYINLLADGILQMQKGNQSVVPYSVFLSWRNTWHAWGNSQASSLLYAGKILNNKNYTSQALEEVKNFYPFLIKKNYLSAFKVDAEKGENNFIDIEKYPQIAYGIRPDVFACVRAFESTNDKEYLKTGITIAGWLFGKNPAGIQMYIPETGRCFDGIKDSSTVNKNSGAESTIEALLTLITLEENAASRSLLHEYYEKSLIK